MPTYIESATALSDIGIPIQQHGSLKYSQTFHDLVGLISCFTEPHDSVSHH